MYSNIGKFEARKIVAEFDALLIQLYGLNMTDARITRQDVMMAVGAAESVRQAVEQFGAARGLMAAKAA
jgi:hypothetical protein